MKEAWILQFNILNLRTKINSMRNKIKNFISYSNNNNNNNSRHLPIYLKLENQFIIQDLTIISHLNTFRDRIQKWIVNLVIIRLHKISFEKAHHLQPLIHLTNNKWQTNSLKHLQITKPIIIIIIINTLARLIHKKEGKHQTQSQDSMLNLQKNHHRNNYLPINS